MSRTLLSRTLLALIVATILTAAASAQVGTTIQNRLNDPRLDIFGGYSHVGNYGVGLNGWIASADWHLFRYIGLEGDINGDYGSKGLQAASILPNLPSSIGGRMHNFNFGPQGTYRAPSGKYNAFGHLLFGFSHTNVNSAGIGEGSTSFSWVLGGGADYNLSRTWAARAQLDLLHTNFFNSGQNHGRIALGVVYRFGQTD